MDEMSPGPARTRGSMRFPTWVEIDLDVFEHNLALIQQAVGTSTRILLVVKADAYGHGAVRLALAAEPKVAMFGVATLHEGIELRAAGVTRPILILTPTLLGEIEEILEYGLMPTVATLEYAQRLSGAAEQRGVSAGFHVEVDTGMGRAGVLEPDAPEYVRQVAQLPALSLEGVYTHFPESDAEDLGYSRAQLERFLHIVGRIRALGVRVPLVHAANSGAIVRLPEARLDLVRPGILAYGLMPRPGLQPFPGIRPVMSMKSRLVQVREFPPGATISYGRNFVCSRRTRIGVVPVGYGHGLSWLLSNSGSFLLGGRRVPIVGNVTMDITMVDVTDVPSVSVQP
jgi:alanine racemase